MKNKILKISLCFIGAYNVLSAQTLRPFISSTPNRANIANSLITAISVAPAPAKINSNTVVYSNSGVYQFMRNGNNLVSAGGTVPLLNVGGSYNFAEAPIIPKPGTPNTYATVEVDAITGSNPAAHGIYLREFSFNTTTNTIATGSSTLIRSSLSAVMTNNGSTYQTDLSKTAFAVSNEVVINSVPTRYLYIAGAARDGLSGGPFTTNNFIYRMTYTASGITGPAILYNQSASPGGNVFYITEMDINQAGTELVFGNHERNGATGGAQLFRFNLTSNTISNNEVPNSLRILGVEYAQNSSRVYFSRSISTGSDVQFQNTAGSTFTTVSGSSGYGLSHLYNPGNGFVYTSNGTNVRRFDPELTSPIINTSGQLNLTNLVSNISGVNMYTLNETFQANPSISVTGTNPTTTCPNSTINYTFAFSNITGFANPVCEIINQSTGQVLNTNIPGAAGANSISIPFNTSSTGSHWLSVRIPGTNYFSRQAFTLNGGTATSFTPNSPVSGSGSIAFSYFDGASDKLVVGLGNQFSPTNSFWYINPASPTSWTSTTSPSSTVTIPALPGPGRTEAVFSLRSNALFVGLGIDNSGTYLSDLYREFGGGWMPVGILPSNSARASSIGFALSSNNFIGFGVNSSGSALQDLYRYDVSFDNWVTTGTIPAGLAGRYNASASTASNGKVYIGLGQTDAITTRQDWWEGTYNTVTNQFTWVQKANFPLSGISGATTFSIGNYVYVSGGYIGGFGFSNSIYVYDVINNRWSWRANFPAGVEARADAAGASIAGAGYTLAGGFFDCAGDIAVSTNIKYTQCSAASGREAFESNAYNPALANKEEAFLKENKSFAIYPNPSNGISKFNTWEDGTMNVFRLDGKSVISKKVQKGENEIFLADLPKGIYILDFKGKSSKFNSKLTIQ